MLFSKAACLIRGWIVLLIIATAACGQEPAPAGAVTAVIIPAGAPLPVLLDQRVPLKRVNEPIRGRLMAPVYRYDRVALPAGTVVEGHVAAIERVSLRERLRAILSGNLTPSRKASARFDTLVLAGDSRLSLQTAASGGTARSAVAAKHGKKEPSLDSGSHGFRDQRGIEAEAARALKAPGRMARLKNALLDRLPYHRQAWPAGTIFTSVLQNPLSVPTPVLAAVKNGLAATDEPTDQGVSARLITPLSSATARRGSPVEAVVTRPQFSADHHLLIPEGSRLRGEVIVSRPGRRFHRNGKLLFLFRQIELAPGVVQKIQGHLEGLQADSSAQLAIDSEGTAQAVSPKTRFIFPCIAVAAAGLSLHQDYNSEGVPDQDIGGRAESGAVGLGLIGTVVAQASRTLASSIAFTGAGFSAYSSFLARGRDVVLPVNTPVEVSLQRTGDAAGPPR